MALKLMYITNKKLVAESVLQAGVDRIFIDLEVLGKEKRQCHIDSVKSYHSINDILEMRSTIPKDNLLVRINPINAESKKEIDNVLSAGAGIIMLPMYKTNKEVKLFIKYVDKRAKTCLLLETKEAEEIIDDTLKISGIDEIHIGLNDLHLSHNQSFLFEPLVDGTVEKLINSIKKYNIPYGFGGVSRLGGSGQIPAELIIAEHYRLGSSMVILSRSFCKEIDSLDGDKIYDVFKKGINDIRIYEKSLETKEGSFFNDTKRIIKKKVEMIARTIKENDN